MSMEVVMVAGVIIVSTLLVMNAVYDRFTFWAWGVWVEWKQFNSDLGKHIDLSDVEL